MSDYITIRDGMFLFWGGWPSQWYSSKFTIDGIQYNCAEQWMMSEKARLFGDEKTLKDILESKSPRKQKDYGRLVSNFNPDVWNQKCRDVVLQGNIHKFTQNKDLKGLLVDTKDLVFVEASPYDLIWGIGLSADDPDATDKSKWRGTNWLGEVLMSARDLIKEHDGL